MKIGDLLDGEYLADEILIIAHALNKDKAWVLSHLDYDIPQEELSRVQREINLRKSGYPLHYIIGHREFMGMEFLVEEGIFIPRPETETLVEIVLDHIRRKRVGVVAEIGIGSGVIAISLAKMSRVKVFGSDINERAVELSYENARRLGVSKLVDFKVGEFLEPFTEIFDEIQLVVSNPPYVEEGYELPEDVKREPREAIFSGKDGMAFIREYFRRYGRRWETFMEFSGETSARSTLKGICKDVVFLRDLDGKERFFFCPSKAV